MSSKRRKQQRRTEINSPYNPNVVNFKPNKVKPKTKNQREVLRSIYANDITFVIGPAGTGKTHLSVGAAIGLLQSREVEKIIISRPIVEAGQKRNNNKSTIGYLPGDINAKMSPFLRPIHDELAKFLPADAITVLKNTEKLEICPLEHMRGRTFENSVIIADEIQNATEEQIEMLLTRLGNGSKMIVVGDIEQSDLPASLEGGFENFIDDLDGLEGLGIIHLEVCDIARHPLVAAIIKRRKEVAEILNGPISAERIGYERQSKGNSPKDTCSKCKHDANASNTLDGCIQENIQGNDLPRLS